MIDSGSVVSESSRRQPTFRDICYVGDCRLHAGLLSQVALELMKEGEALVAVLTMEALASLDI